MSSTLTTKPSIRLPVGLVGPTGGGKTLLALQISHALASSGKHVLYVCLERGNRLKQRLQTLTDSEFFDRLSRTREGRSSRPV